MVKNETVYVGYKNGEPFTRPHETTGPVNSKITQSAELDARMKYDEEWYSFGDERRQELINEERSNYICVPYTPLGK